MKNRSHLNDKLIKAPTWMIRDGNDAYYQSKSEQTCVFQLKKMVYHFGQRRRTRWYISSSVVDAQNISTIQPYFSTIRTTYSTDHLLLNLTLSLQKTQTVIFVLARIFSLRHK